jgi:hypothetical protein
MSELYPCSICRVLEDLPRWGVIGPLYDPLFLARRTSGVNTQKFADRIKTAQNVVTAQFSGSQEQLVSVSPSQHGSTLENEPA